MKIIAIVGFGFCGKLALKHLSQKPVEKIIIFDRGGKSALGPAFSNFSSHYILNVVAEKMSAFSSDSQDFLNFLEKNYPEIFKENVAKSFVARKIYGEYLQSITNQAFKQAKQSNIEIEFVNENVEEVRKIKDEFLLKTKNDKFYKASEVMLATSFSQSDLAFDFSSRNFINKIWSNEFLEFHQQKFHNETICLIGSGLSAVDIITGLKKKNFHGKIFVISRRGNFPKKHFAINRITSPILDAADAKNGVIFLCLKIRNFLRNNQDLDLRHAIDSLRNITKELWQNFDEKNKKLFLKFLPYWNIFRHRAPQESIDIIEEMLKINQLKINRNGLQKIIQKDGKFLVITKDKEILCDYVVNCLGFEFKAEKYSLLNKMIEENLLQKQIFSATSNDSKIHLLGSLNIGAEFECTAVPDLKISVENAINNIFSNQ